MKPITKYLNPKSKWHAPDPPAEITADLSFDEILLYFNSKNFRLYKWDAAHEGFIETIMNKLYNEEESHPICLYLDTQFDRWIRVFKPKKLKGSKVVYYIGISPMNKKAVSYFKTNIDDDADRNILFKTFKANIEAYFKI